VVEVKKEREMKNALLAIVCMATVFLYGQTPMELELRERIRREGITPEEAERIVSECVDTLVEFRRNRHVTYGEGYEFLVLGYDAFPGLYKILGDSEKMQDFDYASEIAEAFARIDGKKPDSGYEKEALEWTRRIVAVHTNPPSYSAGRYLAAKGNAKDISLLRKHGYTDFANELETRIVLAPDTPQTGGANTNTAPKVKPSSASRTNEAGDTKTSSLNRTWLYLVTAILILGIGGFYAWRKKKTRN
jgi:hypothetical protein